MTKIWRNEKLQLLATKRAFKVAYYAFDILSF